MIASRKSRNLFRFIQDSIQTNQFEIVYDDGRKKKATAEECTSLERLAVWTLESIHERLFDHYAGRKNFWVDLKKTEIGYLEAFLKKQTTCCQCLKCFEFLLILTQVNPIKMLLYRAIFSRKLEFIRG